MRTANAVLTFLQVQFQSDGAVIRAENIGIDRCGGDFFGRAVGYKEIVNAPTRVLFTGLEHITPPGVAAGSIGIQPAEGIREACIQCFCEAFTLLVGEACAATVGLGVLQVNFLMSHV